MSIKNDIDILLYGYNEYINNNKEEYKDSYYFITQLLNDSSLDDDIRNTILERKLLFDANRKKTYKDVFDLINFFGDNGRYIRYCDNIKDRFNFWEKKHINPLPKYDEESLEQAAINRAKELGHKNILWSGGVDSTFIVCSYVRAKVPFTIICDENSISDGRIFYEWMKKQNFDIREYKSIHQVYDMKNLISGYSGDTLFSFENTRVEPLMKNTSFYSLMSEWKNRDELYQEIMDYGKHIGRPTNNDYEIARLLMFGMFHTHSINEINYILFPKYRVCNFFNTQKFTDIAYTQFWYHNETYNKPEMHKVIYETTNDGRVFTNIHRVRGKIPPRLKMNQENHIQGIYSYE